jgi:2-dehydropantoate 2-reductase
MKITIYRGRRHWRLDGRQTGAAGHTVSAVARGDTLAALQAHGLRLQQGDDTLAVAVNAQANPADMGVQDLVIVAVKAPAMAGWPRPLRPCWGQTPWC